MQRLWCRYGFYDHLVSMRLMPLSRIVRWTSRLFASSPVRL